MHDVCPIVMSVTTKSRYSTQRDCLRPILILFEAYVVHYHRVNKPLKIHERNSVIVLWPRNY